MEKVRLPLLNPCQYENVIMHFVLFTGEGYACQNTYQLAILLSPSVKRKASIYLNSLCQCRSESILHEIIMISIKLRVIIIVMSNGYLLLEGSRHVPRTVPSRRVVVPLFHDQQHQWYHFSHSLSLLQAKIFLSQSKGWRRLEKESLFFPPQYFFFNQSFLFPIKDETLKTRSQKVTPLFLLLSYPFPEWMSTDQPSCLNRRKVQRRKGKTRERNCQLKSSISPHLSVNLPPLIVRELLHRKDRLWYLSLSPRCTSWAQNSDGVQEREGWLTE